jgi:hypothetical protein
MRLQPAQKGAEQDCAGKTHERGNRQIGPAPEGGMPRQQVADAAEPSQKDGDAAGTQQRTKPITPTGMRVAMSLRRVPVPGVRVAGVRVAEVTVAEV